MCQCSIAVIGENHKLIKKDVLNKKKDLPMAQVVNDFFMQQVLCVVKKEWRNTGMSQKRLVPADSAWQSWKGQSKGTNGS